MPNVALTNVTSGEVSPSFLGRPDVQRYTNACLLLENYLLTTTGMYTFRPGFRLMGFPKDGETVNRLRRFQFSDEQGYILEFGDEYFRVWHSEGQVLDGGGSPVEVATPFLAAELAVLTFTQSADFLFVLHDTRGLHAIKRTSHTSWSCDPFPLKDGPYLTENADAGKTLTLSGLSGSVTVTAAGTGFTPFGAGDEGRHIRVKDGSDWRWLVITAIGSSTSVTATIQDGVTLGTIVAGTPFSAWRLGLYSSRLGWPACLSLHEQRLVMGGPKSIPDRIDGSAIAAFESFKPGTNGNDAWAYALGSKSVNRILGFAVANDLVALTVAAEHRISGDSTGAAITPTAIWQKPITQNGTKRAIEPLEIDNAVVAVDALGLAIRALSYDLRYQGYGADDLTLLADHMSWLDESSKGFQALAWQAKPFGTIWTIRGNDELAGCLYVPKENVLGWHRHPMGNPPGANAAPVVEAIESLKGPKHHELWAVVKRTLSTGVLRTIERMDRPGLWDAPPESQMFLDCGQSLRNTPTADLTLAATSGNDVLATLSNVTGGFAFVSGDVGRFIKYRWQKGRTRKGRTIYGYGIAEIVEHVSGTEVRVDIAKPFPSTAAIAAGQWGLTVTTVTGLDHWNGHMLTAVSDGAVCAPREVVDGELTLDVPGWEVHAGVPYEGHMVTLPLDPGPSPAVGQGRPQRIDRIVARLLNSIGGEYAAEPDTEAEKISFQPIVPYKQGQAAPSAPPQPFSGDKLLFPAGAWTRQACLHIRQTAPLPHNVQLIVVHDYAPWVQP